MVCARDRGTHVHVQVKDKVSGDIYFWNIQTDETTWQIPKGVELAEELSDFRGITKTIGESSSEFVRV